MRGAAREQQLGSPRLSPYSCGSGPAQSGPAGRRAATHSTSPDSSVPRLNSAQQPWVDYSFRLKDKNVRPAGWFTPVLCGQARRVEAATNRVGPLLLSRLQLDFEGLTQEGVVRRRKIGGVLP
jgi:hypothetical protein